VHDCSICQQRASSFITPDESAQPAAKRAKYTAYNLAEKIWLLDSSEQNPKVNAEDCGKALAAEVNAKVQEHERRSPPGKNTVNDWRKMREKLREEQYEKEFAQGTVDKTRVKAAMHGQMEEALYVWFRQMQARDMALTDEILRGKAMQLGPRFEVPAKFGHSPGWLQRFKHRYCIESYVTYDMCCMAKQDLQITKGLNWHAEICGCFFKKGAMKLRTYAIKMKVRHSGVRCQLAL
jgi:hypothetical protein